MAAMSRELRVSISTEFRDSHAILVCLLGSFRLLRQNRPLDVPIAGKAIALLSSLALHLDGGVSREALLETLWPEQQTAQSIVSLNSLVYNLHRRLREAGHEVTAVLHANGSYFLNVAAGLSTDIARFDALVLAGHQLAKANRDTEAAIRFQQAVEVYRGDLCVGADVYAVMERERLKASFLSVLSWLAESAFHDGDYATARDHALRLLAYDPCREDAHRLVMCVHMRRGERAQALRQYRLCELVLREEFDATPEPLTTDLFDRIRIDPTSI